MKKFFVSALAIASLVACSKDELVNQQGPAAISFKQAFVETATRAAVDPSTTTGSITGFDVWGFMDDPTGTVFVDQDVTGSDEAGWTYNPPQYWTPGHTYYFCALAPMNSNNWDLDATNASADGFGVVSFTNVDGTEDLLYATTSVTTSSDINEQPDCVNLSFDHLLSKVKFSFTNGFDASNYSIVVKNIKMTVPANGTIDLAAAKWVLGDGVTTLEFGDMDASAKITSKANGECDDERLTIPAGADQEYLVTFDVELYAGAVRAYANSLSTTISGAALEKGKAYNFHATLNAGNIAGGDGDDDENTMLTPITFDVTVNGWENGNGYEGGNITTAVAAEVASAADIAAAIQEGYTNFVLTDDIDETLTFEAPAMRSTAAQAEYTLNLNGNTISAVEDAIVIDGGAKLTINGEGNVIASSENTGNACAVWIKHGDVIINGGSYFVGSDNGGRNDCIYVGAGPYKAQAKEKVSSATIYGGTFEAAMGDATQRYWVLNLQDDFGRNGSTITVYGGAYKGFDPANNASEGENTNFVAPGYTSKANGEWFEVVK